jgi:hypothetical protein
MLLLLTNSIGDIFKTEEACSARISGESSLPFSGYLEEIMRSGLPGLRRVGEQGRKFMIDSYLDNLLTRDFVQEGISVKQPHVLKRWLASYAAAISTAAGYSEILDNSTAGESGKPTAKTTIAYREALERLWLIDELPAWLAGENHYSRLKKTSCRRNCNQHRKRGIPPPGRHRGDPRRAFAIVNRRNAPDAVCRATMAWWVSGNKLPPTVDSGRQAARLPAPRAFSRAASAYFSR